MAKVHARGRSIIGTVEFTVGAKRYMSDGVILKPDGNGGWRVGGKLKAGVAPDAAYDRAVSHHRDVLERYPSLAAYRAALHAECGLHKRMRLHMAIELMPEDPDGVWSECCDGYGDNVHASIDDIAKLCSLYRLYQKVDAPRIKGERMQAAAWTIPQGAAATAPHGAVFAPKGRTMKMTFKLEIDCDNAAFEDRAGETARILRELADRLDRNDDNSGKLRDDNGNTVGFWRFSA